MRPLIRTVPISLSLSLSLSLSRSQSYVPPSYDPANYPQTLRVGISCNHTGSGDAACTARCPDLVRDAVRGVRKDDDLEVLGRAAHLQVDEKLGDTPKPRRAAYPKP